MSKNVQMTRTLVHFQVKKRVQFGWALYVVGNVSELGQWNISRGIRLKWNQDHYWSGTVQVFGILNQHIEFKYVIAQWNNLSTGKVQWQAGKNNRKIKLTQTVICGKNIYMSDHQWNMQNIILNLLIHNKDLTLNDYFVSGNIKQLGQWKQWRQLRQIISQNGFQFCAFKLQQQIKKELQDYKIFRHVLKVYRGIKELHYYYIKRSQKSHKITVQRLPGRKFDLQNSRSLHPHCIHVQERDGDLLIFQDCHFNQLIYSSINNDIFLGPYIRNFQDLQALKEDNVGGILSIQSQYDYKNHSLTSNYISSLCHDYGIMFSTYSILDANLKDFREKWKGCLIRLIKLIRKCRQKNKKVYLHCTAGIYRSSQILVLYLTLQNKYSLEQAIKFVKRKHPFAQPNKKLLSNILEQLQYKYNRR